MGSEELTGFEITELRLGPIPSNGDHKKRVYSAAVSDENSSNADHVEVNQSKTQVVGWPPVCSYRRKNNARKAESSNCSKIYVKVSMDGAPFLRKIDLNTHRGYPGLVSTFGKLFGCYGNISGGVLRDSDDLEYIPIYEDKDGDWMLVGDVPWEMFIESCKRLRIMKRIEGAPAPAPSLGPSIGSSPPAQSPAAPPPLSNATAPPAATPVSPPTQAPVPASSATPIEAPTAAAVPLVHRHRLRGQFRAFFPLPGHRVSAQPDPPGNRTEFEQ